MSPSSKKSWIWTGSRGYSPDGYLQIGQVLSDPRDPASCLMAGGPLPLPEKTIMDGNIESDVSLNSSREVTASFKAWAEVTAVPVGAVAGGNTAKTTKDIWFIDEVEEKHAIMTMPYLRKVLQDPDVKEHYKSRFWVQGIFKRLYVVTGVRIAKGAELLSVSVDDSGLSGRTVLDGQMISVPLTTGMKVAFRKKKSESTGTSARIFLWAYRLAEINFTPTRQKPYSGGDTQAVEDKTTTKDQASEFEGLLLDEESPLEEEEFDGETGDERMYHLEDAVYFVEKAAERG
ncbi:hypothetical protein AK830_g4705 [Neonectria ditissima]|uniref:Uncharacterized protein n=1 Tax=Neonectria ditissima TaxID=78410 RepID=A0A0P7BMV8_9HYPO|nr:hypothetical protein AK830_g4705 [Neonectria ditissima]